MVTPTLNAERWLPECLESVRLQRAGGLDVEHLVVDDGSVDATVAIAQAAGCRVLTGSDTGIYGAMNLGIGAATGDLVGILNADDLLLPGALAAVVAAFRRTGRPWVVGGARWIDAAGVCLGDVAPPPRWMTPDVFASLGWCCIHQHSVYCTPAFVDAVGWFDPSFRIAGDYDFFARALQTAPYARVGRALACYRRHGHNLSMRSDGFDQEGVHVRQRHGPDSPARRQAYRQALRVWLNLRNPRWALRKNAGAQDAG